MKIVLLESIPLPVNLLGMVNEEGLCFVAIASLDMRNTTKHNAILPIKHTSTSATLPTWTLHTFEAANKHNTVILLQGHISSHIALL